MEPGRWRVGFTKFATRMLGEIVEVQWEKTDGAGVSSGEIIGSIEGFKAISDIYCVAERGHALRRQSLGAADKDIVELGRPRNLYWRGAGS